MLATVAVHDGLQTMTKKLVALSLFWRTFFLLALLLTGGVFAWVQTFRALEDEALGQRLADAAGGASDDDDLVLDVHGCAPPCLVLTGRGWAQLVKTSGVQWCIALEIMAPTTFE